VNGAIGRMNLPRKAENQKEEEAYYIVILSHRPNIII